MGHCIFSKTTTAQEVFSVESRGYGKLYRLNLRQWHSQTQHKLVWLYYSTGVQ